MPASKPENVPDQPPGGEAQNPPPRSVVHDLRDLLAFLKPFKREVVHSLAVVAAVNILWVLMTTVMGKALDAYFKESGTQADNDVVVIDTTQVIILVALFAGAYLLLGLLRAVLIRLREPVVMNLAMNLLRSLRIRLYQKVQQLSFSYLDRLTSGQIIERATGDVNQIRMFLTTTCFHVFDAIIFGIIALVVMFTLNPLLAAVSLVPYPLVCYLYSRGTGRLRYHMRRTRTQVDVMTSQLAETISGVKVIRSFGRHEQEKSRYLDTVNEVLNRVKPIFLIRAIILNGVYVMTRMWVGVVLVVGGWLIIQGRLAPGTIFIFMSFMMMLLMRAQMLMEAGDSAQEARAALERVQALVDSPNDVEDAPNAIDLPANGRGDIRFENASFAYIQPPAPEADVVERMDLHRGRCPAAVRNISLHIAAGETVALVGPTGAGKSTVINLLPRFYDPTQGRVLIDGQDIRNVRLADLRQHIGIVFQETFLFRGTIAENIAYGRPAASINEIMAAARMAAADKFINDMPNGFNTSIGERGVSLSGGQRQRIAIARAILKQPRILVLDDAMAAVDAHTELRIRRSLDALMRGRTTLIIAHRLATVRAADRVIVMRDGMIDDTGKHEHLIVNNEFYRVLCQSQLQQDEDQLDEVAAGGAQ